MLRASWSQMNVILMMQITGVEKVASQVREKPIQAVGVCGAQ